MRTQRCIDGPVVGKSDSPCVIPRASLASLTLQKLERQDSTLCVLLDAIFPREAKSLLKSKIQNFVVHSEIDLDKFPNSLPHNPDI